MKAFGLVEVRGMASPLEHDEPRPREATGELVRSLDWNDSILRAPDQEGRHLAAEARRKRLDPDGCQGDEPLEALRLAHEERERRLTAHRRSDDDGGPDTELVEEPCQEVRASDSRGGGLAVARQIHRDRSLARRRETRERSELAPCVRTEARTVQQDHGSSGRWSGLEDMDLATSHGNES